MKKLSDMQEGDLAKDARTGIIHRWEGNKWVPVYREGQSLPNYLVDRAVKGFVDLPFVPSSIVEGISRRAEQFAPPPGTWAHTAGDVAEFAGGLIPYGSAWKWSAKGLTKLPWLKKAVTSPWIKGLLSRAAVGAGAGVASDVATQGHKMTPEGVAGSAVLGGLTGVLFPSAIGKTKLPPVFLSEEGGKILEKGGENIGEIEESVDEVMNTLKKKIPGTETSTSVPESTPVPKSPSSSTLPSSTSLPPFASPTFSYITKDDAAKLAEKIRRNMNTLLSHTQPPPVSEAPRIRWGEGRGPLTAKEARKAAGDIKKQLKGKRAVIIGGMPLLLDEDDIVNYYNNQIANQK